MINSKMTAKEALGFEIYHFPHSHSRSRDMLEKYLKKGFINVAHSLSIESDLTRMIADEGVKFWVYANGVGLHTEKQGDKLVYSVKDGWKETIAKRVEAIKEAGLWDAVLGFDWDEPMLQSTNEIITPIAEEYAKYGKRQRAIFSYYELIEGSHPRSDDPEFGKEGHLINPDSCKYFTDVGFDWYGTVDYDRHKAVADEMKRRVGRDDVYIWYVPCTWAGNNQFSERHCEEHLEMCYKLLKEEKNPGGLTCYNWYSFGETWHGLDWQFDENNKGRWARLENRMIEIGNELINTKLNKL